MKDMTREMEQIYKLVSRSEELFGICKAIDIVEESLGCGNRGQRAILSAMSSRIFSIKLDLDEIWNLADEALSEEEAENAEV